MFSGITNKLLPVLLEIYGLEKYHFFSLDSDEYSLFSYEKEFLISDGKPFIIESIED